MNVSTGMWLLFGSIVTIALSFDVWHQHDQKHVHAVSMKEALSWTLVWIGLAMAFAGAIYIEFGLQKTLEYLTAYVVEESLSVDNMFVFVLIFSFFKVPAQYQPRVLLYGIFGAIIMRSLFIFTGVALLQRFHWILYVFGLVLVVTAFRMMFEQEHDFNPEDNPVLKLFHRFMPFTKRAHEEKFFIHENGHWLATPLFATLLVVEGSDLIFAVDSIPAVLAISSDPFIVLTSNVFAILGLRALYFMIQGSMSIFSHLKYGLALVLMFIGGKMLISHYYVIPIGASLAIVAIILLTSILTSLTFKKKP